MDTLCANHEKRYKAMKTILSSANVDDISKRPWWNPIPDIQPTRQNYKQLGAHSAKSVVDGVVDISHH